MKLVHIYFPFSPLSVGSWFVHMYSIILCLKIICYWLILPISYQVWISWYKHSGITSILPLLECNNVCSVFTHCIVYSMWMIINKHKISDVIMIKYILKWCNYNLQISADKFVDMVYWWNLYFPWKCHVMSFPCKEICKI